MVKIFNKMVTLFETLKDKDFWRLKFLNLTWVKKALIAIVSIAVVVFAPWLVQFVLNTLFLITSFVVFMIIYAIVKMIRELKE